MAFGNRRIVGSMTPFSSICLTPASPTVGRARKQTRRAPRASPTRILVSGLRNRTHSASTISSPRLFAAANPRFSVASTRTSGNSRRTRSTVSSVEPLSTTTTSRSRFPGHRIDARQARRQPAGAVVRDDDDRQPVVVCRHEPSSIVLNRRMVRGRHETGQSRILAGRRLDGDVRG